MPGAETAAERVRQRRLLWSNIRVVLNVSMFHNVHKAHHEVQGFPPSARLRTAADRWPGFLTSALLTFGAG